MELIQNEWLKIIIKKKMLTINSIKNVGSYEENHENPNALKPYPIGKYLEAAKKLVIWYPKLA